MTEILKIENLMGKYQADNGEVTAIENISLTVAQGEFISIVGPSGCGKSTLLSMISGLTKPTQGKIYIDNSDLGDAPRSHIGHMLQRDNLLEWRSIYRNVLLGLEVQNILTAENIAYVQALLRTYGLYEFKDKYPSQLSGGMRQRAALIRTLAIRPKILLLDEAFSALDYQTRLMVTEDVYTILRNENMTALIVTHDIPESISMADRVVVLSARPSRVKTIYDIEFDSAHRTPLSCREDPKFREYYNAIWRDLDVTE